MPYMIAVSLEMSDEPFILLYCFNFPICFGLIHRIHGLMSVFLECYITLYVFLCCFYVTSVENSIIKNYVEP